MTDQIPKTEWAVWVKNGTVRFRVDVQSFELAYDPGSEEQPLSLPWMAEMVTKALTRLAGKGSEVVQVVEQGPLQAFFASVDWESLREQMHYCANEADNNAECAGIYSGLENMLHGMQRAATLAGLIAEDTGPGCQNAGHMGIHACKDRAQCWEPCGELGNDPDHAVVHKP